MGRRPWDDGREDAKSAWCAARRPDGRAGVFGVTKEEEAAAAKEANGSVQAHCNEEARNSVEEDRDKIMEEPDKEDGREITSGTVDKVSNDGTVRWAEEGGTGR